jgi:hypothetical protein
VNTRHSLLVAFVAVAWLLPTQAQAQRGGPPPAARAAAPIELTGYWVSVVTEDWRYRMVTPARGDYQGVPMTPAALAIADAWDPAADQAAGNQCRSYGAAAIMRVPGRVRLSWRDDNALSLEADAGTQTRLFTFGPPTKSAERSWQGDSAAEWETPGGRGRGGPPAPPRGGSLKVVTTNMRAGYLRKNGIPYSDNAVLTEYFDLVVERNGDQLMVVTSIVEDPTYLRQPYILSSQFKRQGGAAGWDPSPCSSTW